MKRITLVILVLILSSGLCFAQSRTPTLGGGFTIVYDIRGQVLRPAVTWSLSLTKAPSTPLIAEGLLIGDLGDFSDVSYGVGVTTPLTTLTKPLFKAVGVQASEEFDNVLNAVQVGAAVLTSNAKDWDLGACATITAFSF